MLKRERGRIAPPFGTRWRWWLWCTALKIFLMQDNKRKRALCQDFSYADSKITRWRQDPDPSLFLNSEPYTSMAIMHNSDVCLTQLAFNGRPRWFLWRRLFETHTCLIHKVYLPHFSSRKKMLVTSLCCGFISAFELSCRFSWNSVRNLCHKRLPNHLYFNLLQPVINTADIQISEVGMTVLPPPLRSWG